jgi:predicted enzyme related to lactoylglutathione lyase
MSPGIAPGPTTMTAIRSLLLASTDPDRLRQWYADAFGVEPDVDGHLVLGVAVIVVPRDDIADRTVEPGRVLLNFHVPDIRAAAARMDELGAPWVAAVEYRDAGLWFGTVEDPDGNFVQLIEETPDYAVLKARRASDSLGG